MHMNIWCFLIRAWVQETWRPALTAAAPLDTFPLCAWLFIYLQAACGFAPLVLHGGHGNAEVWPVGGQDQREPVGSHPVCNLWCGSLLISAFICQLLWAEPAGSCGSRFQPSSYILIHYASGCVSLSFSLHNYQQAGRCVCPGTSGVKVWVSSREWEGWVCGF